MGFYVNGFGFGNSGAVTFNGVPVGNIGAWNSTQLTVQAPATTVSVGVTVNLVPSGTVVSNYKTFTVTDSFGCN